MTDADYESENLNRGGLTCDHCWTFQEKVRIQDGGWHGAIRCSDRYYCSRCLQTRDIEREVIRR